MDRYDGFINAVLGHGLRSRDPFVSYRYSATNGGLINYREADDLFTGSGVMQKLITTPADDALRAGFVIKAQDAEIEENARIRSVLEDIDAQRQLSTALSWDRLYGGGAVLLLINDGGTLEDPLNENSIRGIERLSVFSPEDISFTQDYIYDNPADPNYGRPQFYTIVGEYGGSFLVHESRLLIFKGGAISNHYRRMRNGWGGTVFEQVREDIIRYGNALSLALMALSRLSQGILKLANMEDLLMNDEGENQVIQRLHLIDMGRHMMNTIALSGLDEYDQKNIALSGVNSIINEFQSALSASSGIPATILFGRSPAGENATGKADMENYYNLVGRIQNQTLRPNLMRLVYLIGLSSNYKINLPDEWDIEFNPLWNPSEKEKAETEHLMAQTRERNANAAKILMDIGALDAAEIRESVKAGGDYKTDDSLDRALMQSGEEGAEYEDNPENANALSNGA